MTATTVTLTGQPEWHFCSKCFGMFYAGDKNGNMGRCPGGGAHQKYGFNFVLPHTVPETPNTQRGWVFCWQCFGLIYSITGRGQQRGVCPLTNSSHRIEGSFDFVLPHDVAVPGAQPLWYFCRKCWVMFYAGAQDGNRGKCPRGGSHAEYGFNFVLPHTAEFYIPPSSPPMTQPSIVVSYNRTGPTFTVSGQGFLSNHVVHVRVVNDANLATVFFATTANSLGNIVDFPITFAIDPPQTLSFSANDERRDPHDLTGTLWSNTVTITAS